MSQEQDFDAGSTVGQDRTVGDASVDEQRSLGTEVRSYVLGLVIAILLTMASFWAVRTHLIYGPGIPMALVVLAVAQMGIHLVFFLHITTGPDNTNNVLALAFGILIVGLVVFGSVWVMTHLNHNMLPTDELMKMQR
jgi:cytochrome o ubiquinol oxidase operon protein cyoD